MLSIGSVVSPIVEPILRSQQTNFARLVVDWSLIVGPPYSDSFYPMKISKTKNKTTLHVSTYNESAAFILNYDTAFLIQRINQFFGEPLIDCIKMLSNVLMCKQKTKEICSLEEALSRFEKNLEQGCKNNETT